MKNTNLPLSPQEQAMFNEYVDLIKSGPLTPESIGRILWEVESQKLFRDTVGNMNTFFSICAEMDPDKGFRILEAWKRGNDGQAAMAAHKSNPDTPAHVLGAPRAENNDIPSTAEDGKSKIDLETGTKAVSKQKPSRSLGTKPSSTAPNISVEERQVRALAGLSPEDKQRVWREAVQHHPDGLPTHKDMKQARIELGLNTTAPAKNHSKRDAADERTTGNAERAGKAQKYEAERQRVAGSAEAQRPQERQETTIQIDAAQPQENTEPFDPNTAWERTSKYLEAEYARWPIEHQREFIERVEQSVSKWQGDNLLCDVRNIFTIQGQEQNTLKPKEIVRRLSVLENRPWQTLCKGLSLDHNMLIRLLANFDVLPRQLPSRRGASTVYTIDQFELCDAETLK